jgi:hypothetical protein
MEKTPMAYFHVTDPAINASHGTVFAASETDAKDLVAAMAGWSSYAEYAAAKHSGTRTLEAEEIKVWK